MAKQFLGYRIKSTNIAKVEAVLRDAKSNLASAASEEYHRFLSEEVCELVDDIAMNIKPRPTNMTILEAATQSLNRSISAAESLNTGTEYDLRSGVSIIPDKGYTYLLLTAWNPLLPQVFGKTEGIEPYTVGLGVSPNSDEERDVRGKKWERLFRRTQAEPALLTATLTNMMQVEPKMLVFPEKKDRAYVRARRALTARLLNQYANGESISSERLMPLMDKALAKVLDDECAEELDKMAAQLMNILVDINLTLITTLPEDPVGED